MRISQRRHRHQADEAVTASAIHDADAEATRLAKILGLADARVRRAGGQAFLARVFAVVFYGRPYRTVGIGQFTRCCRAIYRRPFLGRAATLHALNAGLLTAPHKAGFALTDEGRSLMEGYLSAQHGVDAGESPSRWIEVAA